MKLKVLYNNELAGVLERRGEGPTAEYLFTYEESYLNKKGARPVSVNLPLQKESFHTLGKLFPFFDNLLAEGWLLDIQTTTLKINKKDRFALIAACGLDCVGAVSLRGEEHEAVP